MFVRMTKTCTKCGAEKPLNKFRKYLRNRDGLNSWCKDCDNSHHDEKYRNDVIFRQHHLDNARKHQSKDTLRKALKYRENPLFRAYQACMAILRTRHLIVQFKSLSLEEQQAIIEFYANCPYGYHVDHIYPISKGGLNCRSNLQYLPASTNLHKHAKIPPNTDVDGTKILWS